MTLSTVLGMIFAIVAAAAAATACVALQAVRALRARCESLESSTAALRRELELVASISVRTGRRVQRVEHEYSDVADRVDVVESRGAASGSESLDHAIDLARHGADSDRLTQLGLSHGEADLVARLHGRKKSA